jgi:hypothetical protein
MTQGHDDIHVLRFEWRMADSGFFRVWYNGVQRIDINRTIGVGFTDLRNDIVFVYRNPLPIDSYTGNSPSVAGGSIEEATLYVDRIWRRAL